MDTYMPSGGFGGYKTRVDNSIRPFLVGPYILILLVSLLFLSSGRR
jgi:hypothetical protein